MSQKIKAQPHSRKLRHRRSKLLSCQGSLWPSQVCCQQVRWWYSHSLDAVILLPTIWLYPVTPKSKVSVSYAWQKKSPNFGTYRLGNIVDNNRAVCIPVVHRRQRLISFLACSIPDLKLHCCIFIQSNCLRKKGGADRRLAIVIKLVLCSSQLIHLNPSSKRPCVFCIDLPLQIAKQENSTEGASQ